jgi:hypothetical protein
VGRTWAEKDGAQPIRTLLLCGQNPVGASIHKSEISPGIAVLFAPAMVFIDEKVIGKYRGASVEISRGN